LLSAAVAITLLVTGATAALVLKKIKNPEYYSDFVIQIV